MPWGRRCDLGCASWPDADDFDVCPQCEEPTTRFSNLRPLDLAEGLSTKRALDFERYYAERHEPDLEPREDEGPATPG